jgi:glycosyltransferase involved in cell wall biosynthesis
MAQPMTVRLFQNAGLAPGYIPRLDALAAGAHGFAERRSVFLADRYGGCHLLWPSDSGQPDAFFTNGDDTTLQRAWAREQGMPADTALVNILLAQIEHHRTEVFYNGDPVRYGSDFIRRLPGTVRVSIAWRAAPSGGADLSAYTMIVNNFPSLLEQYRRAGLRAEYFAPSHDPQMDAASANVDRPIDVLFVGTFSRHHRARVAVLAAVAALAPRLRVEYRLDLSKTTRWGEGFLGRLGLLRSHRRPKSIEAIASGPVYGRELYGLLSRSKIVLNGAIDMAGRDRGNMRCWEALGCGAALVSDEGNYPAGMAPDRTIATYADSASCVSAIEKLIGDPERRQSLAGSGNAMIVNSYSRQQQWARLMKLIEAA